MVAAARFYSPAGKQLLCYYYVADVLQPRLHVDGSYLQPCNLCNLLVPADNEINS